MRGWRWTFVIIAAGLAAHLFEFFAQPRPITVDSLRYIEAAGSLLRDGTLRAHDVVALAPPTELLPTGPLVTETIRTPGYPLFLALCFRLGMTLRGIALLQHALVIALAALMHRRNFGGFAGALLVAVSPQVTRLANEIMTEGPACVLAAVAVMLLVSAVHRRSMGRGIGAGVLCGIVALIRPIALYLPLPLAFVLAMRRPTRALAVPFLAAALVLPASWTLRNYRATGVATFSSIDGESALLYRAAGTLVVAHRAPLDALTALQQQTGFYRDALYLQVPLVREALAGRTTRNHAERSRLYRELALRKLAAHPFAAAAITISALGELLFDDLPLLATPTFGDLTRTRFLFVPVSIGFVLLAALGCRALFHRDRGAGLVLATALVYFVVMSAGPEADARFVAMFAPLYAAAIGMGLEA